MSEHSRRTNRRSVLRLPEQKQQRDLLVHDCLAESEAAGSPCLSRVRGLDCSAVSHARALTMLRAKAAVRTASKG